MGGQRREEVSLYSFTCGNEQIGVDLTIPSYFLRFKPIRKTQIADVHRFQLFSTLNCLC